MSSTLTRYLHEEIKEWYRVAYGDIKSHKPMIEYYSFGTPKKVNYLLSGFENHFEIEQPKNILDVGCGYGSVAAYLATKYKKSDVSNRCITKLLQVRGASSKAFENFQHKV